MWSTHEEVVRLNAEEFAEVSECNRSVRTEPEITVVVSRSLVTSFPDDNRITIITKQQAAVKF